MNSHECNYFLILGIRSIFSQWKRERRKVFNLLCKGKNEKKNENVKDRGRRRTALNKKGRKMQRVPIYVPSIREMNLFFEIFQYSLSSNIFHDTTLDATVLTSQTRKKKKYLHCGSWWEKLEPYLSWKPELKFGTRSRLIQVNALADCYLS